ALRGTRRALHSNPRAPSFAFLSFAKGNRLRSIPTQSGAIRRDRQAISNIFLDWFLILPVYCFWSVLRPGFAGAFLFLARSAGILAGVLFCSCDRLQPVLIFTQQSQNSI